MRKFRPRNLSKFGTRSRGDIGAALLVLRKLIFALKRSDDDLDGYKPDLIDAMERIFKGEKRADRLFGLSRLPGHPENHYKSKRNRIIALQYWDRLNRTDIKSEPIAKSIGKFWSIGERRVRQIVEPLNNWAMGEIAKRGGEFKITHSERESIRHLKRILKRKKEGN